MMTSQTPSLQLAETSLNSPMIEMWQKPGHSMTPAELKSGAAIKSGFNIVYSPTTHVQICFIASVFQKL